MSQLRKEFNQGPRTLRQQFVSVDFVVVGGGLAGVCAAIAAARKGLDVVLVQDRPVLGGNASSEIRLWALGATSHMGNNNRWARESGIIGEILEENLFRNREGNPVIFDLLLLELVRRETNIQLLLNTAVLDAETIGDSIKGVKAFNSQNSTLYDIRSNLFCDATGDGVLGYLSGADYRVGAEDKNEFDEKFAPDEEYGQLMGHSIYFYTRDTGKPVDFVPPAFALEDITEIPRYKRFNAKEDGCNLWWIEYGGRLDTVHDTEEIKWELWKVVHGVWNHIKNSGEFPESENMTLEWVGHIPGKRESRRFEGDYMLNQSDVVEQKSHYDAVSFGGWSIDLHPADGVYSDDNGCHQWHSKGVYQIPFRTMYSRNVSNLLMTGRLISASHVAFASTRVMLTCAANGQVAGTAAAVCKKYDLTPRELAQENHVSCLQQKLLRSGHFIPGIPQAGDCDLALAADMTVSSTLELQSLKPDATWQNLSDRRAMMIPVPAGSLPAFSMLFNALEDTSLEVSLRRSDKLFNHTPEVVLDTKTLELKKGEQESVVEFSADWTDSTYAFICLEANNKVDVALSSERLTGILSLAQKGNTKVALGSRQEPSDDIGFDAFDFWLPERRPEGKSFAVDFSKPLAIYQKGFMKNGIQRPVKKTNAWLPARDDAKPTVTLEWAEPVTINQICIHLDNDFDHPMETVQWGHTERVTPFCVRSFRILDARGKTLIEKTDNHLSFNKLPLPNAVTTRKLVFEFDRDEVDHPAVFGISCY
ncbi:FAD-binding dehydrogenase [Endozoicomonas sp. OPT23]|uniref:FAD-dependent oxidoreductase n=1 Tax=Endozoicomonas sp. OPT23 TaxID=2072845 RepID=UPI00129A76EF|nr:FAD-dependent oxidoreductase [Endozoicomonas sp. OPT23]MRI31620.1 FAD-binding dehydrogenase [Endozoicomonas sp. OPT23]